MTSPGEVTAQLMQTARNGLSQLSESQLLEYRALINGIVSNKKFAYIDEYFLHGLTPKGKLMAIDQVLETYRKRNNFP